MHPIFKHFTAVSLIVLASSSHAFSETYSWLLNYEQAKETAAQENKDILMDFTGSDWCTYCIQLDENVFSKDDFSKAIPKHFVLLKLDFPQDSSRQSSTEIEQNNNLHERYQIAGFPTIFLSDSKGRAYAKLVGYEGESASEYVSKLMELKKLRVQRDECLKKAKSAKGVEKAKLLDRAISLFDTELALSDYQDEINQIIELDKNDETGLHSKYQSILQLEDIQKRISDIINKNKDDKKASLADLNALKTELKPIGAVAAELLYTLSFLKYETGDKTGARADLEAIIELDPKASRVDEIQEIIDKIFDKEEQK